MFSCIFSALTDLKGCIELSIKEQRKLCCEVANSTLSATRLRQRLIVARRYFTALSRHKPQEIKDTSNLPKSIGKLQKTLSIMHIVYMIIISHIYVANLIIYSTGQIS